MFLNSNLYELSSIFVDLFEVQYFELFPSIFLSIPLYFFLCVVMTMFMSILQQMRQVTVT